VRARHEEPSRDALCACVNWQEVLLFPAMKPREFDEVPKDVKSDAK
jgi:hypothetical protein